LAQFGTEFVLNNVSFRLQFLGPGKLVWEAHNIPKGVGGQAIHVLFRWFVTRLGSCGWVNFTTSTILMKEKVSKKKVKKRRQKL